MCVTALLYIGPLLAGLAGDGWAEVPVFTAIFLLWQIILRPNLWPRTAPEWLTGSALLALVARGALLTLLVAICFGIGRGIGGVLGYLPNLPAMLPIGLSFLAIPLGRMIWNPAISEETDPVLDTAIARLKALQPGTQGDTTQTPRDD